VLNLENSVGVAVEIGVDEAVGMELDPPGWKRGGESKGAGQEKRSTRKKRKKKTRTKTTKRKREKERKRRKFSR
jgi:hypothetical protein